ncbi:MAG: ATP-binding protein [Myxococcota bacterium]
MESRSRLASFVERLLPEAPEDELRSRFFVWGWLLSASFLLAWGVVYAIAGPWSQLLICLGGSSLGAVVVLLHRRGVSFDALVHLSLAIGTAVFSLSALAQTPADFTSVSMLIIMPLLTNYLLGRRAALLWLVVSIVVAAFVTVCVDRGWTLPFADPLPTVTHVVNLSTGVVTAWLLSRRFDDLRQESMRRLEAADRARRAFLANVSHEIRTPMNGVLGMTEVLLQDEALSARQRDQLSTVQRSGRVLVALINDLLDLSKMEAGKLVIEEADFNLDTVLSDLQALLAPAATQRGLALELRRDERLPPRLRGDALRLGQVLNNLLSNAVKFTSRGSVRLEVSLTSPLEEERLRCRFEVADTGAGIAPEVLPRLFSAFEQGDVSTTRRFGGTGLGLALSQQLVGLMGGRIEVSSRPGVGSRFWFELPMEEAREPSGVRVTHAPGGGERRPVLVVDDNPINLKVAQSMLERAGFTVEAALDGRQALEAVQRRSFALVLMDCHMPEMDGFEATERIRALTGDAARTPIIALTASAMPDDLEACRRAGMNQVLTKPLSFTSLCAVLDQVATGLVK